MYYWSAAFHYAANDSLSSSIVNERGATKREGGQRQEDTGEGVEDLYWAIVKATVAKKMIQIYKIGQNKSLKKMTATGRTADSMYAMTETHYTKE